MNDLGQLRTDQEGEGDEWLASFSDMITLLLCFFVVLMVIFAIKEAEEGKGGEFQTVQQLLSALDSEEAQDAKRNVKESILQNLQALAESDLYKENVTITEKSGIIEIVINENQGRALFASGSAHLTSDAQELIYGVFLQILPRSASEEFLEVLYQTITQIEIQGHTDRLPMGSDSVYPSNWELSLARANNVRRFLDSINLPKMFLRRVHVTGYADNKPAVFPEVVRNNPEQTRSNRGKNRRVVLILSMVRG
jgi:chemotaxis protein MotB